MPASSASPARSPDIAQSIERGDDNLTKELDGIKQGYEGMSPAERREAIAEAGTDYEQVVAARERAGDAKAQEMAAAYAQQQQTVTRKAEAQKEQARQKQRARERANARERENAKKREKQREKAKVARLQFNRQLATL